ncbi:hypothetical protein CEQ90_02740 [Lewinellaceae bacterium SD302]|nr:hypothetical protein CEQ90_02740 [Lewinellaceae bacterium SD302]
MTKLIDEQKFWFLNQLDLPAATSKLLQANIRPVYLKRGEKIVQKGDICRDIYLVVKGILRAYKDDAKADSVYAFYKENDFFTIHESFMDGIAAETNVEAIEDCELYVLSWEKFKKIGIEHPSVHTGTFKALSGQLANLLREKNRLLNLTATQRYLYFLKEYPELVHRVSLGHISSYLGMRQSSLSRVRRDIHKEFIDQ